MDKYYDVSFISYSLTFTCYCTLEQCDYNSINNTNFITVIYWKFIANCSVKIQLPVNEVTGT